MYNHFFGLQKAPFSMTPDPALLFMPPQHREALAGLTYAILNRKGFAVLIGDAGTGKTTLLSRVLRSLPKSRIHSSIILNPTLTANEFLEMALMDFGITEVPPSKAQRLASLHRLLLRNHTENKVSVLIIDEAHKLSPVLLEEVRLLSNFEFAEEKLLQIVLSGQNELGDVLNEHHLRQLKQRIAVRLAIGPLAKHEVEQYIRYRWTKCGGAPAIPFSVEAVEAIASWSQGIPRLINSICDNALTAAFGLGASVIEASHITEVAGDLDLKAPPPEHHEPAPVSPRLAAPVPPKLAAPRAAAEMPPIRVFDRERLAASTPSLLSRWTRRLGLTQ